VSSSIRWKVTTPALSLPSGVARHSEALELSQKREGMNMTIAGICELVLETDDVAGLRTFYEELGLDFLVEEDERIWLRTGERCRLGIWSPGEKEFSDRGGRHVHFALSVGPDGLDALSAQLRERGVEVEGPVEHDGGDRSVYFFDPAGNRVELWDFFRDGGGAKRGVMALAEDARGK
jgi:catechol 2,3-dioxygenase-like lactoylglutathione lyase family enzyme